MSPRDRSLVALIDAWSRKGDPAKRVVLEDAFLDRGQDVAAEMLNGRALSSDAGERYGLRPVLRDLVTGRVVEEGEWVGDSQRWRYMIAIETPTAYRLYARGPTRRVPWALWGTYTFAEFPDGHRGAYRTLQSDLRYERLPFDVRTASRSQRRGLLSRPR